VAERLGIKTNVEIFLNKREYLENPICTKPWTQMGVRFDGEVEPCALSKEIVGDVSNNSLREIWKSSEYREIRRRRISGKFDEYCKNCDIYDQHMFRFSGKFYLNITGFMNYLWRGSQI
jgi:radical SAM protein with 4Fe4S-binding SPASM domain